MIDATVGGTDMVDRRSVLLGLGASLSLPGFALAQPQRTAGQLLAAARRQVGITTGYDGGYSVIGFPNGDVPRVRGVCTDVIIRAYRDAFGLDLQALVNTDMRGAFGAYPRKWGLRGPDRNIDHRRVPNLATWFARHGARLAVPSDPRGWRPGDIFTSLVDNRGAHVGFVSDRRGRDGWQIIHNIGAGAREEDALFDWPLTGRYRWAIA